MPAAYTVPDNPDNTALELIMGIPAQVFRSERFADVLREYTSALRAEHAFAGLSWADARHVAAAISYDVRVGRSGELRANPLLSLLRGLLGALLRLLRGVRPLPGGLRPIDAAFPRHLGQF
jgi:hypothetical protein